MSSLALRLLGWRMEDEDSTVCDIFRLKCHRQTGPHSKLVKGQPFAGLSENLAPSKFFQTSSPTMIRCCELICHVNLMQKNMNRSHLTLAKKQVFTGDCFHGEKPLSVFMPLLLPIQAGQQFPCRWLSVQWCDCLQECGCNPLCGDTTGFAASDCRRAICVFLRPLWDTAWHLS